MSSPSPYALSNAHDGSVAHHRALTDLLDPFTTGRLSGLGDWTGAACLELGAGAGGVAHWLADRVGPDGLVVATDVDLRHLPTHPRLRTRVHDLTDPTPYRRVLGSGYDLIHARLVLAHLPARASILRRLVTLLAPGGTILIEDWAARRGPQVVVEHPDPAAADLYRIYQRAAGAVFDQAGTDPTWAGRIHTTMQELGLLTSVDTVVDSQVWTGGGAGMRLLAATLPQLADRLAAAGMTQGQLDQLPHLFTDPNLVAHGHPLHSTSGRRLSEASSPNGISVEPAGASDPGG